MLLKGAEKLFRAFFAAMAANCKIIVNNAYRE